MGIKSLIDYSADIWPNNDWSMIMININTTINPVSINPTFNDITIANADVTLADPMDITGTLTLTTGDIISDPNDVNVLTIKSGGTITGGSDDSHVVGPINFEIDDDQERTLPVGDGNKYRPVFITPASGGSTYTAEYFSTAYSDLTCNPGDIDHVAPGIYWDIDNNGGAMLL